MEKSHGAGLAFFLTELRLEISSMKNEGGIFRALPSPFHQCHIQC